MRLFIACRTKQSHHGRQMWRWIKNVVAGSPTDIFILYPRRYQFDS